MAAVDYAGIEDAIATILRGDSRTQDAHVFVEEDPQFGLSDFLKGIAIYLEDRIAPEGQSLSAGKRTRFEGSLSIWSIGFHMESFREACTIRDALLGQVELVLMANRTIQDKVRTSWLNGGKFLSARANDGSNAWVAAAETRLTFDVSAINS